MGRKKKPIWAVVAADSRAPRDGKFIEDLGRYYPLEEPARVELKDERVKHWLKVGAQPTDTVRSLLSRQGLLLSLHMERKGAEPDAIAEAVEVHQQYRRDKIKAGAKVTAAELRHSALDAELKEAEKREAELLEKRKKAAAVAAEEKARKQALEAEGKADEETTGEEENVEEVVGEAHDETTEKQVD